MDVDLNIAQLQSRNPDALRLAQLCGFAVRLEPHLLRVLRRKFIPNADPSAELDLWHSPLVQSRGASVALLDVEALNRVRDALADDPARALVLATTLECFSGYPALQRFEIELNSLAVIDRNVTDATIEKHFEPLIAALREGGDAAQRVARWLLQAAPRWHQRVRNTASAWASLVASSALLDGRRLIEGAPPAGVSGERLAQALPATVSATRAVGVERTTRHLRFLAPEEGKATIMLPNVSPALLLLEQEHTPARVIDCEPGAQVALKSRRAVTLRALTGDAWRVELLQPKRKARPGGAPWKIFLSVDIDLSRFSGPLQRAISVVGGDEIATPTLDPIAPWDLLIFVLSSPPSDEGWEERFPAARDLGTPVLIYIFVPETSLSTSQAADPEEVSFIARLRQTPSAYETFASEAELVAKVQDEIRMQKMIADHERPQPAALPLLQTDAEKERAIRIALEVASAKGPQRLRKALSRDSPDVHVWFTRGPAMVSVSEGEPEGFEADRMLKGYEVSNHLFADVFGGVKLRWPVVLFLSAANRAGVDLKTIDRQASVISLGRGYSLIDVVVAYDRILRMQDIRLVRAWFIRHLRSSGIDPERLHALRSFVAHPAAVREFLQERKATLLQARTLLVLPDGLRLDLDAIARELGQPESEYAVLSCDSSAQFHLERSDGAKRDFSRPQELKRKLAYEKLAAVFAEADSPLGLWEELAENCFESVRTVVVLAAAEVAEKVKAFPAFRGFQNLIVEAALHPNEQ